MPDIQALLEEVLPILQFVAALMGAYFVAFWLSIIVWTYNDITARTRDLITRFLAISLVVLFSLPGLLLYFFLRPRETLAESYDRSLEEEALFQELDKLQACPSCKSRIEPDFLICPNCLAQLKSVCFKCHHLLRLSWKVCPYCGMPQELSSRIEATSDARYPFQASHSPDDFPVQ